MAGGGETAKCLSLWPRSIRTSHKLHSAVKKANKYLLYFRHHHSVMIRLNSHSHDGPFELNWIMNFYYFYLSETDVTMSDCFIPLFAFVPMYPTIRTRYYWALLYASRYKSTTARWAHIIIRMVIQCADRREIDWFNLSTPFVLGHFSSYKQSSVYNCRHGDIDGCEPG